jgi:flavodoxin
LKTALHKKGFDVIGEFGCLGFDTFALTKLVGGINKGRPNQEDLQKAEDFAKDLINKIKA